MGNIPRLKPGDLVRDSENNTGVVFKTEVKSIIIYNEYAIAVSELDPDTLQYKTEIPNEMRSITEVNGEKIKTDESKLWEGMTYEQAHRALWNWLADHPDKDKADWFHEYASITHKIRTPDCFCFACEAAEECNQCPLGFTKDKQCTQSSAYKAWRCNTGYTRSLAAKFIAELPWREVK